MDRLVLSVPLLLLLWFVAPVLSQPAFANTLTDAQMEAFTDAIVFGKTDQKVEALEAFEARGKKDVVASLVIAYRYRQNDQAILATLSQLTGAPLANWRDAMEWQEAHPEIKPHSSYTTLKHKIYDRLDPNFAKFLGGDKSKPENLGIRFEEIVWGGVRVDGIPSLDNPDLIDAKEATYMIDEDLVFGVEINGDARAYPLRIMGWHEMFNETIGGVPVALAYCTLCGAGILFETQIEGRDKPFVFGSSGLLYRSNKLMFDRQTNSLWNQFTGEPVSGPLYQKGIRLKMRPVAITSWANWRAQHPKTRVLSVETGHSRDYSSGNVYKDYFASPDLMFPVIVRNEDRLKRKDYVFGIREFGTARAWPVTAFADTSVINDQIGDTPLVLIGDAATRTVRAYQRKDHVFNPLTDVGVLTDNKSPWQVTEEALISQNGEKLPRVPGHISYWFAWDSYLGVESSLYSNP